MCLGIPGRIVDIADPEQLHVTAEIQGVRRQISAALLGIRTADGEVLGEGDPADAVGVGDWVEVHLGFAMGRMDESEAREVLDGLRALEETYERELAGPASGAQGSGAQGSGAQGSGAQGSGAHGPGAHQSGVHGSGVHGSGARGSAGTSGSSDQAPSASSSARRSST